MSLLTLRKRAAPPAPPAPPTQAADPGGWTPAEIAWLKARFATDSVLELSLRYPHRTLRQIYAKAGDLGLACEGKAGEIDALYAQGLGVPGVSLDQMREMSLTVARGMKVGRLREIVSIEGKALHKALLYLGVSPTKPRHWTPEQDEALRVAFAASKIHGAMEMPGKEREDLHLRLVALDLIRGRGKLGAIWDERYLRAAVARRTPFDEMAWSLRVSPTRIVERALEIGIGRKQLAACPAVSPAD